MGIFDRTELIVGKENLEKLFNKNVIVFGVGGVGGYVCEMLVRMGIGKITIVDFDTVSETNINRQIIALHSTIGKFKVDVMKDRMLDINPKCEVNVFKQKYCESNAYMFDLKQYDYVADCIDSFNDKIYLIKECKKNNVNIISSMGTGRKFGIPKFNVVDVFSTSYDGLAKKMRKVLRDEGILALNGVCAEKCDDLNTLHSTMQTELNNKNEVGSLPYFPAVAGMVMASKIIKDFII